LTFTLFFVTFNALCLKEHINQRRKRELAHTDFGHDQPHPVGARYSSDEKQKGGNASLQHNSMFSSVHRLARKSDIEKVLRRGRPFHAEYASIKVAPNNRDVSRFTVVVSLKISKKAVDRNRIKRQLREILRTRVAKELGKGYDVLVWVKKPALGAPYDELSQCIYALFKKARLV